MGTPGLALIIWFISVNLARMESVIVSFPGSKLMIRIAMKPTFHREKAGVQIAGIAMAAQKKSSLKIIRIIQQVEIHTQNPYGKHRRQFTNPL